jgi:hypothetical protein
MNNELHIGTLAPQQKFVTYLSALFELRNANFLPILSPYETFHSKTRSIALSCFHPIVLLCYHSLVCMQ